MLIAIPNCSIVAELWSKSTGVSILPLINPDGELSKIEPTYGYQAGDPLPEGVTQDNYIIQQGGQPFQFAPESELNPIQSTPSQTTVPVEA